MIDPKTNKPTSYDIAISEEQRVALHKILVDAGLTGHTFASEHPLAYWVEMLADLPKNERENPNVLHGFCL